MENEPFPTWFENKPFFRGRGGRIPPPLHIPHLNINTPAAFAPFSPNKPPVHLLTPPSGGLVQDRGKERIPLSSFHPPAGFHNSQTPKPNFHPPNPPLQTPQQQTSLPISPPPSSFPQIRTCPSRPPVNRFPFPTTIIHPSFSFPPGSSPGNIYA